MSKINDGGPAFPKTTVIPKDTYYSGPADSPGMSLRDYFAAAAMQGMLSGTVGYIGFASDTHESAYAKGPCNGEVVSRAYAVADAMLAARTSPTAAEQTEEREENISKWPECLRKIWDEMTHNGTGIESRRVIANNLSIAAKVMNEAKAKPRTDEDRARMKRLVEKKLEERRIAREELPDEFVDALVIQAMRHSEQVEAKPTPQPSPPAPDPLVERAKYWQADHYTYRSNINDMADFARSELSAQAAQHRKAVLRWRIEAMKWAKTTRVDEIDKAVSTLEKELELC